MAFVVEILSEMQNLFSVREITTIPVENKIKIGTNGKTRWCGLNMGGYTERLPPLLHRQHTGSLNIMCKCFIDLEASD